MHKTVLRQVDQQEQVILRNFTDPSPRTQDLTYYESSEAFDTVVRIVYLGALPLGQSQKCGNSLRLLLLLTQLQSPMALKASLDTCRWVSVVPILNVLIAAMDPRLQVLVCFLSCRADLASDQKLDAHDRAPPGPSSPSLILLIVTATATRCQPTRKLNP